VSAGNGKRATCQACRKLILLRNDGTLRVHPAAPGQAANCPGSGALAIPGGGDETWIMPDGSAAVQMPLFPVELLTGGDDGTT
jgi:hypothetical protein